MWYTQRSLDSCYSLNKGPILGVHLIGKVPWLDCFAHGFCIPSIEQSVSHNQCSINIFGIVNKRLSGWINLLLYSHIYFHVSRETTQLVIKWMNRVCQALCQGWGHKSEQKQTRPCPRGTSKSTYYKSQREKIKPAHIVFSLSSREARYRITPWLNYVSFKSPEQGSPVSRSQTILFGLRYRWRSHGKGLAS